MKRQQMTGNLMLIVTAFIWGCAFVAQSVAMDSVGPWTFTCVRSWIAGFVLLAVIRFLDSAGLAVNDWKGALKPGIIVGLALTAASMLQQIGIQYTTVGKAGFITALYVVLVPIFSSLLGRKVSSRIWISAGIAAFGLYLLCMQGGLSLSQGDFLVFLCAIAFAVHILVIDSFQKVDGARMSCIQFFTVGIVTTIPMLVLEHPHLSSLLAAAGPILYAGILSSGAGYTLQILGQKHADPSVASILMSLESVFSVLAGFLFLHQAMSAKELAGCALMFGAIVLAQIPEKKTAESSAVRSRTESEHQE